MAEHFVVSGVFSLMEVSFPNLGTSSVQVDVSQICCVPDNVFMITSSNVEEGTLQCRLRLVKTLDSTLGGTSGIDTISDNPRQMLVVRSMICIEMVDTLRVSCRWDRHCQTSRYVKILIFLIAKLKLWMRLQSSVSV